MIRLFLFILATLAAFSQNVPSIIQGQWPGETFLVFRDGSNNQQYICTALSKQPTYTWSTAAQITSIADSGSTSTITFASAHGLTADNRIYILGMTSAGTSNLNQAAGYVVTISSTTVVTITTTGVTDGTYTPSTDPSMRIWTTAPRTNANIWQIRRQYFTTTYVDGGKYPEGDSEPNKACDSRTTYAYQ